MDWRGIGTHPALGLAPARGLSRLRRRDALRRRHDRRSPSLELCIAGEVLQGRKQPHDCRGLRRASARRNPRWARRWSPPRGPARPTTPSVARRGSSMAFECPLPIQDYDTVTMGHGGGGKLSQRLDRATHRAGAGQRASCDELHDGAVVPCYGGHVAFTTDSFVVRPHVLSRWRHRLAGRARHGQRPGDVRCAAAAPVAGLHPRGGLPAEGPVGIVVSIRERLRGVGDHAWSPATPRSSSGARATGSTSTPRASGRSMPEVQLSPRRVRAGRQDPAQRIHRAARHGHHVGARGTGVRERDHQRLGRALAAGRGGAERGPASACTRCATPRAAAWPRCSTRSRQAAGVGHGARRERDPGGCAGARGL